MHKQYRTYQIMINKKHSHYAYFEDVSKKSKLLYNKGNFFIRQVYSSLKFGILYPLQLEVMETINGQLPLMNNIREERYRKKLGKDNNSDIPIDISNRVFFQLPTKDKPVMGYQFLECLFKTLKVPEYCDLPTQTAQNIIRRIVTNWFNYFYQLKGYKKKPSNFTSKPNPPNYIEKELIETTFTNQQCNIVNNEYLKLPYIAELIHVGWISKNKGKLKQVRITPQKNYFDLKMIFEKEQQITKDENKVEKVIMGIDLGVTNLATIVTNTFITPYIIKGSRVKYINQFYIKRVSEYMHQLNNGNRTKVSITSKRIQKYHRKRLQKLKDYFHKTSNFIVKLAEKESVDVIVIGHNKEWKRKITLGKKNNQNMNYIPHSIIINQLKYKAEEKNIKVLVTEESYTSKASFLDIDFIPEYDPNFTGKHTFSGVRICRGLYKSKTNIVINADVNGACNIIRKVFPDAFENTIVEGVREGLLLLTPKVVKIK